MRLRSVFNSFFQMKLDDVFSLLFCFAFTPRVREQAAGMQVLCMQPEIAVFPLIKSSP